MNAMLSLISRLAILLIFLTGVIPTTYTIGQVQAQMDRGPSTTNDNQGNNSGQEEEEEEEHEGDTPASTSSDQGEGAEGEGDGATPSPQPGLPSDQQEEGDQPLSPISATNDLTESASSPLQESVSLTNQPPTQSLQISHVLGQLSSAMTSLSSLQGNGELSIIVSN